MKPQLNLTTAAWAAGIYEGEGTCDRNKCVVRITQKDSWILKQIAHLFGGKVARHGGRYWRWTATGIRARFFIVTVWPWLSQGRREQAGFIFELGAMEKALWNSTVEAPNLRRLASQSATDKKSPRLTSSS